MYLYYFINIFLGVLIKKRCKSVCEYIFSITSTKNPSFTSSSIKTEEEKVRPS